MTYLTNEFNLAHVELFAELEKQAAAVSSILPEIEIDSLHDEDFGVKTRYAQNLARRKVL
jgi:hypothetical protein